MMPLILAAWNTAKRFALSAGLIFVCGVAVAEQVPIKTLQDQWHNGDRQAARLLMQAARDPNPNVRWDAGYALCPPGGRVPANDAAMEILYDDLMAIANELGKDPVIDVRQAGGLLATGLQSWKSHDSAAAIARLKKIERIDWLKTAVPLFIMVLVPWGAMVWLIVSRGGLTAAIVSTQPEAVLALAVTWRMLAAYRAIRLLPALSAIAAVTATGAALCGALTMNLPAGMTDKAAHAYALMAILRPPVLAAYFCSGFVLFVALAALQRALIEIRDGGKPHLFGCLASALRRWPALLALSAATFGALLFIEVLFQKKAPNLPRAWHWSARMAAWLVEFSVLAGALVMTASMMSSDDGLKAAFERVKDHPPKAAKQLLIAGGAATATAGESGANLVMVAFLAGMFTSIAGLEILPEGIFFNLAPWLQPYLYFLPGMLMAVLMAAAVAVFHMTAMACLAVSAIDRFGARQTVSLPSSLGASI